MRSETTLHIALDHPAFEGHFPSAPIVPGVVLLDAAIYALQQMLRPAAASDAALARRKDICQISSAKFLSPIGPGETLTISLDTTAPGSARFEIKSGSRRVAAGTLVLPSTS